MSSPKVLMLATSDFSVDNHTGIRYCLNMNTTPKSEVKNTTPKATGLIGIQDEYVETVNAGIARWSHRRKRDGWDLGGHANRILHGAHRVAAKKLTKLGFTQEQIRVVLKDAWEMAALIRHAEAE